MNQFLIHQYSREIRFYVYRCERRDFAARVYGGAGEGGGGSQISQVGEGGWDKKGASRGWGGARNISLMGEGGWDKKVTSRGWGGASNRSLMGEGGWGK